MKRIVILQVVVLKKKEIAYYYESHREEKGEINVDPSFISNHPMFSTPSEFFVFVFFL
jgi:hypothetical protein